MPKLTPATESSRISAVLQVITLMQRGAKLEKALKIANLSVDQYYDWVNRSEETIEIFYEMIDQSEKRELASILSEREYLLNKAIIKAKREKASIYDILSIVQYMDKRREEIETRQGVTDNAELKAKKYLSGPMTKIQSSRLSASAETNEDGSVTVKIKQDPEIIESKFLPKPQPEQESNLEELDPFARPGDLDLPLE